MAEMDPIRTVVRIVDGATFPETKCVGARWRQKDGRGYKPFHGFVLLPEGADPVGVAARFRQVDGYSVPTEDLHRAAVYAPPPKRRTKVKDIAAMALPKQIPLLGDEP